MRTISITIPDDAVISITRQVVNKTTIDKDIVPEVWQNNNNIFFKANTLGEYVKMLPYLYENFKDLKVSKNEFILYIKVDSNTKLNNFDIITNIEETYNV